MLCTVKLATALTLLATTSLASPVPSPDKNFNSPGIRNDLLSNTPCRPITLIFARGTDAFPFFSEGNTGYTVGPALFDAIEARVGPQNLAVQGVDYKASVPGYFEGGDDDGSNALAKLVILAQQKCPQTSLFVSGYSQGAQLVHKGLVVLPWEVQEGVEGVLLFGDPNYGQPIGNIPPQKIFSVCHEGDSICQGPAPVITWAHLTYGQDAEAAAEWVGGVVGW